MIIDRRPAHRSGRKRRKKQHGLHLAAFGAVFLGCYFLVMFNFGDDLGAYFDDLRRRASRTWPWFLVNFQFGLWDFFFSFFFVLLLPLSAVALVIAGIYVLIKGE